MKLIQSLSNGFIKFLLVASCKIDKTDLAKIPMKGPFILVSNHINFLEAPLLYIFMRPRRTIALGKAELWNKKVSAYLMNLWEVIPLKRGITDIKGMNMALDVLKQGDFLCLAPEGTRSKDGKLLKGKGGVILFAEKSGVPIIPVAHYGGENFFRNLKRFRRTPVVLKVGAPLKIKQEALQDGDHKVRQALTDEIMISLARLLPEKYHGYYKGRTEEPFRYLTPVE